MGANNKKSQSIFARWVTFCLFLASASHASAQEAKVDFLRDFQTEAIVEGKTPVAHWGWKRDNYTQWTTHSNRLIPVYTYGTKTNSRLSLKNYTGENSVYRRADDLKKLYGELPKKTLNASADYMDQTDIFHIQKAAFDAGKRYVFLVVFDGMDWQTTRAASIYNRGGVVYDKGRGEGTHFQDYDANGTSEYGWMVTSPYAYGAKVDVDKQTVGELHELRGGFDSERAGEFPWSVSSPKEYIVAGPDGDPIRHAFTDSAASATSMMAGIKTYNGSINVGPTGEHAESIAHYLQAKGWAVGAVSSVPISHATPACSYAHNVERSDYQDIMRDLVGLPSIAMPNIPHQGLDVLIGGGWADEKDSKVEQGVNYLRGNPYCHQSDIDRANLKNGGKYVVAQRTSGTNGRKLLFDAMKQAIDGKHRLLGEFGVGACSGHLPYQTADGDYQTAPNVDKKFEDYSDADVEENPTLEDMTSAAVTYLDSLDRPFWLLVEPGDVDWANHSNNIDNAIGAVKSGDGAVKYITDWVEANSNWEESLLIVTADHGHYLVLEKPEGLVPAE